MFKNLFSWWKEDILLKEALEKSALALEKAGKMFSFSMEVLVKHEGKGKKIYDMDKEVNALQVDIRRKVLGHLAVNAEQDISASLVLTTMIVDLERIGDFAKNIVELDGMCIKKLDNPRYDSEIQNIRKKIEIGFGKTGEAFSDADPEKAGKLMIEYTWIGQKCDSILQMLVGDESLKVREAVVYGLLFRYLKRISGHLRNICSSVVNPFDSVGYKPKGS